MDTNKKIPTFKFDQDEFENYVSVFCTEEEIMTAFHEDRCRMDVFCKQVYGMNFSEAYRFLMAKSIKNGKKLMKLLAEKGNTSAIAIYSKFFMEKEANENGPVKIEINTNIGSGKDEK